ncbi:MAG TPA: putative zinc-binding metallopeptidase [Candidatus Saccharimonadales bacterium]|nr:putative zinc-binding metallopeptidase [Candidatus Saccharimonadales bacterium]
MRAAAGGGRRRSHPPLGIGGRRLGRMSDEEILGLRLCDLTLTIKGSLVEKCIERLDAELAMRGVAFRPHFWISDEFFSPDGVPGIAVPFYLVHPRLARLEKVQMLEVEGGTPDWCMRILRHEAGHALDSAHRLRRKKQWREIFGPSSAPYPSYYSPRPRSRNFVLHLDWWYAQSHPLEDFAETFAVWMKPGYPWRARYRDWPALRKLEYVDRLMKEIRHQPAPVTKKTEVDPISKLHKTLRRHYKDRRDRYGAELPDVYDRDLRRLFSDQPDHAHNESAARFLFRKRKVIRDDVSKWTGQHAYTIDLVLREMMARSRSLDLRVAREEQELQMGVVLIVTVQVMNFLHSGHHRIAL